MNGWSPKWIILVLGTIALLVTIGLQVDLADMVEETVSPAEGHAASPPQHLQVRDGQPPIVVGDLHCFACHAQGNFNDGGDFPHATHAEEGLVHCHRCHAFQGHFEVTTREEICEECH